ncbi:DUF6573 family protein [Paenibacillus agilis]|uniref:Uncharacterized protein n=1 Tax=Paenibacillus agilis TaxID=3020863 RepID=A0A559ID32_9BACL|nr:DUF6573 family protein [Paenibacillus agilis]TVX85555.1 hypothetical protein FPZ44_24675 [Paenibacillus agilis]
MSTTAIGKNQTHAPMKIIDAYSRAQFIADGGLIDVTATAKTAGLSFPVGVTRAVWDTYIVPSEGDRRSGESTAGRLWDTLWMLKIAAKKVIGKHELEFGVLYPLHGRNEIIFLKCCLGSGDLGEPVLTIMLPKEEE